MTNSPTSIIKIIIVGEKGVGKKSIFNELYHDKKIELSFNTLGQEFRIKEIQINEMPFKIYLYDITSNNFDVNIIKQAYSSQANQGFILCYDITNRDSFTAIKMQLQSITDLYDPQHLPPRLLLGNKNDEEENRQVEYEKAEQFAIDNQMKYFETHANETDLLDNIILELAKLALNYRPPLPPASPPEPIVIPPSEENPLPILFHSNINLNEEKPSVEKNIFWRFYNHFILKHVFQGPRGDQLEEFGKLYQQFNKYQNFDDILGKIKQNQKEWQVLTIKQRKKNHIYNDLIKNLMEDTNDNIKLQLKEFNVWKAEIEIQIQNQPNALSDLDRHKEVFAALENPYEVHKSFINRLGY